MAGLVLVLFLAWWFTRDVTYVTNVKVSGLDATQEAYRGPLRSIAEDMGALVTALADRGYAWEPGALPALRADGSLSAAERARAVALGTLRVKSGGSLSGGDDATAVALFMESRGWALTGTDPARLSGASREVGPLRATVEVQEPRPGVGALTIVVTAR